MILDLISSSLTHELQPNSLTVKLQLKNIIVSELTIIYTFIYRLFEIS